jgi:hypothetical protein
VPQSLLARADEVIANVDLFRQVAPYVARILNGERCAQSGLSSRQTRFRNGWPPGYAGGAKSEPVGGFEIVDNKDGNRRTSPH